MTSLCQVSFVHDRVCERTSQFLNRCSRAVHSYPVQNAGVDDYFVDPQYWRAELADKAWRKHPSGSHGC
jgi:hypothetical protein